MSTILWPCRSIVIDSWMWLPRHCSEPDRISVWHTRLIIWTQPRTSEAVVSHELVVPDKLVVPDDVVVGGEEVVPSKGALRLLLMMLLLIWQVACMRRTCRLTALEFIALQCHRR